MDINELQRLMRETGACIRAIPLRKKEIHETDQAGRFPEGRIAFLPSYKRKMLVVETVPKHAGEFLVETGCGTDATIRFSGKRYFDDLEDAADALARAAAPRDPGRPCLYRFQMTIVNDRNVGLFNGLRNYLPKAEIAPPMGMPGGGDLPFDTEDRMPWLTRDGLAKYGDAIRKAMDVASSNGWPVSMAEIDYDPDDGAIASQDRYHASFYRWRRPDMQAEYVEITQAGLDKIMEGANET